MTPTPNQHRAIHETGNLLVVAAAGAGKTGTLVQRCLRLLLDPENPVAIRRILVVTFTEAAAAEVRQRLREKLEQAANANPSDDNLQQQLANIDSAYISTLHAFCFQLVRRHVLQLGLDPAVKVLEPYQSKVEFQKTFDSLVREHYGANDEFSEELKALISSHHRGWDQPVRWFVETVHEYTQTRPNPEAWFTKTQQELSRPDGRKWHEAYADFLAEWCDWWLPYLETLGGMKNAAACAQILREAKGSSNYAQLASKIIARDKCWNGQKTAQKPYFKKLFDEAEFLASLEPQPDSAKHPLDEDWEWMRTPLSTLVKFAREFSDRFRQEKFDRGVLDFHDLEQLALKLLVHPVTSEPTDLAREWQEKFDAIFVDEYQDINAAQDLIITALSSPAATGNRFLVGDAKQSIYRFRQADPSIFQKYFERPGWSTIPLSENFRSHEGILNFINPIFRWLMNPEFGGLQYTDETALKFGNATERSEMRSVQGNPLPVEFHLWLTDPEDQERDDPEEEPEIDNAEREARLVAGRLRALKESGFSIYHQKEKQRRSVEWRDMVVLLRAAKNKLEVYAKAFGDAGVPLQTKRSAFFTTQEVLDLCSLLQILDNPLQDIPLVAVLRSPIVGLTDNELAAIRIHSSETPFWRALNQAFERKIGAVPREKLETFLKQFHKWRDCRRCSSLAQRLEAILTDTGYGDWLLAQPRGRERAANVRQLVRIARQFDEARSESLYLFLKHIEELQEAAGDIEPASCVEENAVRLMTVHQSKGLEFPIVALADLGKQFNFAEQNNGVRVHERYGLCSTVKPPHTGQRYASLPLWLARRTERRESIGEEMRVLYVALTRAQNHLLLFGSTTEKRATRWDQRAVENPFPQQILQHRSWLDWLGTRASLEKNGWFSADQGSLNTFSFRVYRTPPPFEKASGAPVARGIDTSELRLDFVYPQEAATRQAAKTSVTALRQQIEKDDETSTVTIRFRSEKDGTERGLITHTFLELHSLDAVATPAALRAETERLVTEGFLTVEQIAAIDIEAVHAFWTGAAGRDFLRQKNYIRRELPFTIRATRDALIRAGISAILEIPGEDFVVLQGIADLVLLTPKEIWLLDFKSDRLEKSELKAAIERYRAQVQLYATALAAIYNRGVTRQGIFFLHLRHLEWLEDKTSKPNASSQLELGF